MNSRLRLELDRSTLMVRRKYQQNAGNHNCLSYTSSRRALFIRSLSLPVAWPSIELFILQKILHCPCAWFSKTTVVSCCPLQQRTGQRYSAQTWLDSARLVTKMRKVISDKKNNMRSISHNLWTIWCKNDVHPSNRIATESRFSKWKRSNHSDSICPWWRSNVTCHKTIWISKTSWLSLILI